MTTERQIPESRMPINPVVINDSHQSALPPKYKGCPETISTAKLITWLKDAKVDTHNVPDNKYLYSMGRNLLVDLLLVSIYSGEFGAE